MPISHANGVDIFYEKAGSGPPFVMLHAMPFDHNLWLFQAAQFSSHFTTIAMDLRGWGRSGKPVGPFSVRDMGADVMGLLTEEGLTDRAVIMGCSFGSKIALTLALDYPDVFDAVVLVGGNSGLQPHLEPHIAAYREASAAGRLQDYHRTHLGNGVTKSWAESAMGRYLIDGFVERGRDLNAESIARVFEATMNLDLTSNLADIQTPTLIVNGEYDSAFAGGARTASLIPDAERRIIPDVGHCSFIENPAHFDELVRDFLISKRIWPGGA